MNAFDQFSALFIGTLRCQTIEKDLINGIRYQAHQFANCHCYPVIC